MNFKPTFTESCQVFNARLAESGRMFAVDFVENQQTYKQKISESDQRIDPKFQTIQTVTQLVGGDVYSGEYEVTPHIARQVLATKYRVMNDDVTIREIPYSEASNVSGGMTATIG